MYISSVGTEKARPVSGFTLVELAIVMTIIGLLIGGILQGRQLLRNAQLTSTYKNYESIMAATIAFRDKYNQLPGDISTATTRIPGCNAANNCVGGSGNNQIAPSNAFIQTAERCILTGGAACGSLPPAEAPEALLFWKHLILADYISLSGVNAGADPNAPVIGETNPITPLGGGFTIYYYKALPIPGVIENIDGHWLRIPKNLSEGFANVNTRTTSVRDMLYLEQKFDDMDPVNGRIWAQPLTEERCLDSVNFEYGPVTSELICVPYFHLL